MADDAHGPIDVPSNQPEDLDGPLFDEPLFDEPLFDETLAELAFLGPDQVQPAEAMPAAIWDRLSDAIRAEAPLVSGGPLATVLAMSPRRRSRWVSGLVAASVAAIAVGVVVQVVRTPSPEVVVAEAGVAGAPAAAEADQTKLKTSLGVSGETMPARQVIASGANYTRTTMQDQIGDLFERIGVADASAMASIIQESPENLIEGNTGFTAKVETIKACIAALIEPGDVGTVVIDRAMFEQQEIALILDLTPSKKFKAWVVGLDCGESGPSILMPLELELAEQSAP
jgi:negative regulator of sigma E activity